MAKNRSALRAGLLMVGSIALIVCVIIGVKGMSFFKDPKHQHIVAFDLKTDIGGLNLGDEVRIGGAKVGQIDKIFVRLDEKDQPPHILIVFSLPKRYVVREDARLRRDGTLTGSSWLNFETMGVGKPLDPKKPLVGLPSPTQELLAKVGGMGEEIQTIVRDIRTKTIPGVNETLELVNKQTVPRVNQTIEKFGQTADSFKKTGDTATALATDIRASYKPIIDKYNATADKAIAMMESIRAVFGDTNEDIRVTMNNLRKSTDEIRSKLPEMLNKVNSTITKVETAMDKVNKSLDEVHTTVVNAKDLSASAREVITGNKAKLNAMIDSLKKTGDNLKNATAEVRRSPWRLLYKPAPNEMANLNIYDSARQFAEGAESLSDASEALKDAIKSGQARPDDIQKLIQQMDESFKNFKAVEEKLWASVKE